MQEELRKDDDRKAWIRHYLEHSIPWCNGKPTQKHRVLATLQLLFDMADDYDGETEPKGLMELIDTLVDIAEVAFDEVEKMQEAK